MAAARSAAQKAAARANLAKARAARAAKYGSSTAARQATRVRARKTRGTEGDKGMARHINILIPTEYARQEPDKVLKAHKAKIKRIKKKAATMTPEQKQKRRDMQARSRAALGPVVRKYKRK